MARAACRWLLLSLVLAVSHVTVSAHQLDEYVQATLVDIDPAEVRLHINLTPGVEVVDQLLPLIDGDRDGAISRQEAEAYAGTVNTDLAAWLDGRKLELRVAAVDVPDPSELRGGWGIVRIELTTVPERLTAGQHKLAIENRHSPSCGAYLLNAARPRSDFIKIIGQSRNDNQSRGEIEFSYDPPVQRRKGGVVAVLAALVLGLVAAALLIVYRGTMRRDQ